MVTDRNNSTAAVQGWDPDSVKRSPMFAPLAGVVARLPQSYWPDVEVLNRMLELRDRPVTNACGAPIRFVTQVGKPACFEEEFEPRTFLRGEVLVRSENWHDLFNALVWITFPKTKAVINARHYGLARARKSRQRTPAGDALTHFDEDGAVVISSSGQLLDLLRRFRWLDLFRDHRDAVKSEMRFLLFGHAMYEKALRPFVGITAKSILLQVPEAVLNLDDALLNEEIDQRIAAYVSDPARLKRGKTLAPLPVLGVPGWWPPNERLDFYDDASYFRPGRLDGGPSE